MMALIFSQIPTQISNTMHISKESIAVQNYHHLISHALWIIRCYLPPGSGDFPACTPAEACTQFSEPEGCKTDLTYVVVISQDSLVTKDSHLSTKYFVAEIIQQ